MYLLVYTDSVSWKIPPSFKKQYRNENKEKPFKSSGCGCVGRIRGLDSLRREHESKWHRLLQRNSGF